MLIIPARRAVHGIEGSGCEDDFTACTLAASDAKLHASWRPQADAHDDVAEARGVGMPADANASLEVGDDALINVSPWSGQSVLPVSTSLARNGGSGGASSCLRPVERY